MLNQNDPNAFRVSSEAAFRASSETKPLTRKAPVKKPKRDFEKVMKKKEKPEEAKEGFSLARKSPANLRNPHGKSLLNELDETPTSALLGGVASKQGIEERPEFMQEQPDLAALPPPTTGIQNIGVGLTTADKVERANPLKQIQEIVDQIIHKLYTVKQEGKTDTVLVLRHPPLFAGAHLRITAYDTARGEFNISFSQLSMDAKALLDMNQAQFNLQKALEQKGYTAHIVVITTEKDEPIASSAEAQQAGQDQRDGQEDEYPEDQRQKKDEQ